MERENVYAKEKKKLNLSTLIDYYKHKGLIKTIKQSLFFIIKTKILKNYAKLTNKGFTYNGEHYNYFYHDYNNTYTNERSVEIPIFQKIVEEAKNDGKKILEVGNVTDHYKKAEHKIVDKFESSSSPHLIKQDIMDLGEDEKYDLIISISTIEHIDMTTIKLNHLKYLIVLIN